MTYATEYEPAPNLLTTPRDWIGLAACRGYPPDWWYPDKSGPGNGQRAIDICRACPVIAECAMDANERDEPFGIWGAKPRRGTSLGSPHRATKYEEPDPPQDMRTAFCGRCKQFWATTARPEALTSLICPDCIGKTPPVVHW